MASMANRVITPLASRTSSDLTFTPGYCRGDSAALKIYLHEIKENSHSLLTGFVANLRLSLAGFNGILPHLHSFCSPCSMAD